MKRKFLKPDLVFDLINAFKSIKSADESALFLQDILTATEIKNLSIRLRIAKLLLTGEKQRDISQQLNVSIATVIKVSAWLNQKGDGFKQIISRLPQKYDEPTNVPRGPIEFHLPEILAASIQYRIAKHQDQKAKRLIVGTKEKTLLDKELKQISDEMYKHRRK